MNDTRPDPKKPAETAQQLALRPLKAAIRTGVKAGMIICRPRP
jgi:hypothetical protein